VPLINLDGSLAVLPDQMNGGVLHTGPTQWQYYALTHQQTCFKFINGQIRLMLIAAAVSPRCTLV
jgi:hypothetical protein